MHPDLLNLSLDPNCTAGCRGGNCTCGGLSTTSKIFTRTQGAVEMAVDLSFGVAPRRYRRQGRDQVAANINGSRKRGSSEVASVAKVKLTPRDTVARSRPVKKRLTHAERTALSDGRMFNVAAQLISERGTHNTTLKDIGEMAGYSRALAGSRYGTKDALFFELLKEFNRKWKDASASAVGLCTGLDALRLANRGLIGFFQAESTSIRAMYMICYEMVGSSELMRQHLDDQHEAYRHGVARWIKEALAEGEAREDVSPDGIGLQYVASVFGLIYQWLVQPEKIDIIQGLHDLRENTVRLVSLAPAGARKRP